MNGRKDKAAEVAEKYREEATKPAIVYAVLAVALVSAPLAWGIRDIEKKGVESANTAHYSLLAATVGKDVAEVRKILASEVVEEASLVGIAAAAVVEEVPPESVVTNESIPGVAEDPKKLEIRLSAIYWNARAPLATIDGETYRAGETVKGFKIVEIRETEVEFKGPLGDTVIKYFYDYLEKPKR